ncbi:MAG: hypothetical protein IKS63_00695 [Firmicutes bacterium]|nr:hypothetical protein [Bacillota bacterium]
MKEGDSVVTGIIDDEKDAEKYPGLKWKKCEDEALIVLDGSFFFPTGGGQSCDKGIIAGLEVIDVFDLSEEVFHRVKIPSGDRGLLPEEGSTVPCALDWPHRFDNMQRHCGEHILSGMFHKAYGGVNRGFHMGDEYMTVDISLEDDPAYDKLSFEMALHVEDMTNEAIWANLPVTTRRFATRAEAENRPLRKKLAIDEDISIVCVGDENDPSDCVACCGTHPATSGQVGLVKIYKVEKNKNMFRVYFDAGNRAMKDYNKKHDILTELGNRYSAGTDDLLKKIDAQEKKNEDMRNQLHKLRQSVIASYTDSILEQTAGSGDLVFAQSFDDLKTDDLMRMGNSIMESIPEDTRKLVLLTSESENTTLLFSKGDPDCGALVKEYAPALGGKGGGKPVNARAMFPSADEAKKFISLLCNQQ